MDSYANKFWEQLPGIIQDIAGADYVAIDLEMTGIKPRHADKLQKPTQEEIYRRAKEAAQTYRMIQLGLTCLRWDKEEATFRACSYTFHVSPLFDTAADSGTRVLAKMVDRNLVVSYKTLLFLQENRVRLEDSYMDGIHYLSRAEEAAVKSNFLLEASEQGRENIDIPSQNDETRAFYYQARDKIKQWEENSDDGDYVNISHPQGGRLSRFQQRLIHQLLDNEFPKKYIAVLKENYFMQILKEDDPNEEKYREEKIKIRDGALKAQRGLRYILEALTGGDFAKDTVDLLDPRGDVPSAQSEQYTVKLQLDLSETLLKLRTPVLVGHSMFFDLCFLYETFFQPLPETLVEFRNEVHKLFPRIVDTKYLATQDGHRMASGDSLEDLYTEAVKQPTPSVVHMKPITYNKLGTSFPHNAGFDSSMTATLFVKTACRRPPAWAPLVRSKVSGVPIWSSEYFQAHRNKVRIGNAGILDFEPEGREPESRESVSQGDVTGAGKPEYNIVDFVVEP